MSRSTRWRMVVLAGAASLSLTGGVLWEAVRCGAARAASHDVEVRDGR